MKYIKRYKWLVISLALWLVIVIPLFPILRGLSSTPSQAETATQQADVSARIYLPQIYKSEPTPTPTNTPTPTPTSTPTNTPTPIPTSTPTNTPTPTPTRIPAGVVVLADSTAYTSSDYLHVVGEVMNNTNQVVGFVKISVNFYNSQGQLVGTEYTYANGYYIGPGVRTCFNISLSEPNGWTSYSFEPVNYNTMTTQPLNLAVLNPNGSFDRYGDYNLIGEIKNNDSRTAKYPSVSATLFNEFGKVVGCDHSYANNDTLAPGQSSAFKLTYSSYNLKPGSGIAQIIFVTDGSPQ